MVIATGFGLLALFSVLSILFSGREDRPGTDRRDDIALWMRYGLR
jgi:hypothetical protein